MTNDKSFKKEDQRPKNKRGIIKMQRKKIFKLAVNSIIILLFFLSGFMWGGNTKKAESENCMSLDLIFASSTGAAGNLDCDANQDWYARGFPIRQTSTWIWPYGFNTYYSRLCYHN